MATTKLSDSGTLGNKYENLSADNNYMETIASTLVASATSTITFSNIPQGYKHLQLRLMSRHSATGSYIKVSFNGDTSTSSYTWHYLSGNGTAASSGGAATGTYPGCVINNVGGTSTAYAAVVMDILDYTNTNKYKTTRTLGGADYNGSGAIDLASSLWLSTSPINSISMSYDQNDTFAQYSRFSLYGIKG
jgi:hypothetical protein